MSLAGWNSHNRFKLTVDGSKVDGNLTDFPVSIVLSSGTGQTSYDVTDVFDELSPATISGVAVSGTHDDYTKLILHMDGLNNSTTFIDDTDRHTITAVGDAKISTSQFKFNGSSGYFDGTGDYLTAPDSNDWDLGTGDFTLDCWMYPTSIPSVGRMAARGDVEADNGCWCWGFGTTWGGGTKFNFADVDGGINDHMSNAVSLSTNTWYHAAIVRCSGNITFYLNGISVGTSACTHTLNSDKILYVGCRAAGPKEYFPGYIDELRISKGTARWTSNFIPPTGPYGSSWDNRKKIAVTTDVSGIETELYTEIERWDDTTSSGNKQAWLWTKVPTLVSGIDTDLYLYYDINHTTNSGYIGDTGEVAAQNVWDSGFKGVWHMTQDPTGGSDCMWDSTSNVNHGTPGGDMLSNDLVDGKVGKAIDFDGGNDYLGCGTDSSLDLTSLTIEAVAYKRDTGFNAMVDHAREGLSVENYDLFFTGSTLYFQYNSGGWQSLAKTNYVNDSVWFGAAATYNSGNIVLYKDGVEVSSVGGKASLVIDTANVFKIARYQVGSQGYANMIIDEVRVSSISRSPSWLKATYYSNWNDLITFSEKFLFFSFSNPIPIPASTVYGTSQTLQLTVTVSGEDPSYIYDASFYDASDDSQIGSTISGTNSGNYVSTIMSTPIGTGYNWYLSATSSGEGDTSSTYSFNNRFLCQGTTEVNGTLTSGIPVRLYKRDTGELIGSDISTTESGVFSIETDYNDYHFAIAFSDDVETNALIYDYLKPGE